MKKNIYNLIWKWHFIGGLISLPIVVLLSITGIIYLFKDNYENKRLTEMTHITPKGNQISYQEQWEKVENQWGKKPEALVINDENNKATEFTSGMFSHKSSFFIHPYTGEETGRITLNKTDMHQVRKLHGELLLGKFGTKIVELVASWMIVLLFSGIYLFWPRNGFKSLFTIRTKLSKRILFRDIHAVTGFWFSFLIILILAGGLPWTDVFGSGYKWVQDSTESGFPSTWSSRSLKSVPSKESLPLDDLVNKSKQLHLNGKVSIHLPNSPTGIYSISNETSELSKMKVFHFDQYSGKLIKSHTWADIGIMMKTRIWVMAFHQGQFGTWNFLLIILSAFALIVLSLSAVFSYLKRKPKENFRLPSTPKDLKLGVGLITMISILGLILPLFGISLIFIVLTTAIKRKIKPFRS